VRKVSRSKKKNSRHADSDDKKEHKSTILGCSSNLINAIVGAGIVGLPFAIQESGLVPGIVLTILCALLTEKSLRLLIETAKHSDVPSYETLAEAAYGKFGFLFVTVSMFVMAYGAMLTYLMIVKDSFSSLLGVAKDDVSTRAGVLITVSSLVILPLSCQRDMADLAKTSKMNVCFDLIMVLIVVYLAFHNTAAARSHYESVLGVVDTFEVDEEPIDDSIWRIRWDTIFVGLGVLSFAFVCQHSAFIIAGSLENPTKQRWSRVTRNALGVAACLALLMGISGCLGFGERVGGRVTGNILNSLPQWSKLAQIAKGLLGTTMVFVYPMESFVARHACVVMLFEGRKAHEGDDTSVLNRRDRRITLTVVLYLSAVIPAAVFQDLGGVLAVSGSIGGSTLSYIGPGMVYIGIHGGRFLELTERYFGRDFLPNTGGDDDHDESCSETDEESTPLFPGSEPTAAKGSIKTQTDSDGESLVKWLLKTILWYLTGMPVWTVLASIGKGCLTTHVTEMALKSPHPIRIGNVRFARAKVSGGSNYTRVVMLQSPGSRQTMAGPTPSETTETEAEADANALQRFGVRTKLLRADSCPKVSSDRYKMQTTSDGTIVALPALMPSRAKGSGNVSGSGSGKTADYQSINQKIGAMAMARAAQQQNGKDDTDEFEDIAIEEDPQGEPPGVLDFAVAMFYVLFGLVAMIAGLGSIV